MPSKEISSPSCCICDEIDSGKFPSDYYRQYPIQNRLCYESEYFVLFPSVSPLVSGHVLIFPKKHITCLFSLRPSIRDQLVAVVQDVNKHVRYHFGSTYVFEHGVVDGKATGCGINHAHLHIVPLPDRIIEKIGEQVKRKHPPIRSGSLEELLYQNNIYSSYLLFGKGPDNMSLSFSENIASQYMRQTISKEIGDDTWDWKALFGWENFNTTLMSFTNFVSKA